ncbi:MAG TPA: hypothetical protein VMM84_12665 [Pyrinomonadaceae bacterium]|nr:hypothetical protein [Pyrinomonadaceae bacterium]
MIFKARLGGFYRATGAAFSRNQREETNVLRAELKTPHGNEKFEFERLRIDLSFSIPQPFRLGFSGNPQELNHFNGFLHSPNVGQELRRCYRL